MLPDATGALPWPRTAQTSWRFMLGLAGVFALFEVSARSLGSDRGQAGLVVGALVVGATLAVDHWLLGEPLAAGLRRLGLGAPKLPGVFAALFASALLLLVVPAFIGVTGARWTMYPGWIGLLPGLFAQAGVAEEVLFRGYLFRHLRRGRSFWRAALLASGPFVLVHLWLFFSMSWPVALASVVLSALISIPFAYLFELGGNTIWGSAILHWVVQGGIKVIVFDGTGFLFAAVWMLSSAVLPFVVFVYRRDAGHASAPVVSA
jgi:membrane protease YdiL (CAAX protease family)